MTAVLEHSRKGGSPLFVLFVIASYSDHNGEWQIDQATLQKRARLGQRRIQQILAELAESGELEVVRGDGRGRTSTYRVLAGPHQKGEAQCTLSSQKGEAQCTLSETKGEAQCTLSPKKGEAECTLSSPAAQKGEAECTLSGGKGEAECTLSAGSFPPTPPLSPVRKKEEEKSSALGLRPDRPLTDQQSAVHRVRLRLEEAGVPTLPSPGKVGEWIKLAGGTEALLNRLDRLISAGLATKNDSVAYVQVVLSEEARRGEGTFRPRPIAGGRAGLDRRRQEQALRLLKRSDD